MRVLLVMFLTVFLNGCVFYDDGLIHTGPPYPYYEPPHHTIILERGGVYWTVPRYYPPYHHCPPPHHSHRR